MVSIQPCSLSLVDAYTGIDVVNKAAVKTAKTILFFIDFHSNILSITILTK